MTKPVMVGCTCTNGKVYLGGIMPRPCPKCGGTGLVPQEKAA